MLGNSYIIGLWFLIAVLILIAIILSSKFALQVVLFYSICLSIIYLSISPVLIVSIAILIAWFTPGLGTREVLLQSWHHKIWYSRNASCGTTAEGRNKFRDFILLPHYIFTNRKKMLNILFYKNSFFISIFSVPLLFFLAHRTYISPWIDEAPSLIEYFSNIVVCSIFIFLLVSTKWLSFLGQAERYFEYSTPFIALVSVYLLIEHRASNDVFMLAIILFISLVTILLNYNLSKDSHIGVPKSTIPNEFENTINWMDENIGEARVLVIPIKRAFLASFLSKKQSVLFYFRFVLRPNENGYTYLEEDTGGLSPTADGFKASFEIPRLTPFEFSKKYGITHMLIDKQLLHALKKTWKETYPKQDNYVYENEKYLVIKL